MDDTNLAPVPGRGVLAGIGLPSSGYMFQPQQVAPTGQVITLPNGITIPAGMLAPAASYAAPTGQGVTVSPTNAEDPFAAMYADRERRHANADAAYAARDDKAGEMLSRWFSPPTLADYRAALQDQAQPASSTDTTTIASINPPQVAAPADIPSQPAPSVDMSGATDLLKQGQDSGYVDADGRVTYPPIPVPRPDPVPQSSEAEPDSAVRGTSGYPVPVARPKAQNSPQTASLPTSPKIVTPSTPVSSADGISRAGSPAQPGSGDAAVANYLSMLKDPRTAQEVSDADAKRKNDDRTMALLTTGLGMMAAASRPGATALGALGAGGMEGAKAWKEDQQQAITSQVLAAKQRADTAKEVAGLKQSGDKQDQTVAMDREKMAHEDKRQDKSIQAQKDVANIYSSRSGGSGDGPGNSAVERIAANLMDENPNLSYADALTIAKHGNGGQAQADLRKEGLAAAAARSDVDYLKDPAGTMNKWRTYYGLGPKSSSAGTSVAATAPAPQLQVGQTATGPNGQKVRWTGLAWEALQ